MMTRRPASIRLTFAAACAVKLGVKAIDAEE
jgi:hypothetical protein